MINVCYNYLIIWHALLLAYEGNELDYLVEHACVYVPLYVFHSEASLMLYVVQIFKPDQTITGVR